MTLSRESIVNPGAFVVEGHEDMMHSCRHEPNGDDLDSLIASFLTL